MFADAEGQLERILALVAKCPEKFQAQAFEILLKAYVDSKIVVAPARGVNPQAVTGASTPPTAGDRLIPTGIPEAIRPRMTAMAGRLKVQVEKIASLFDFQVDPFTFHGLSVPGSSKAEKARNVALLLSVKSYLATGVWSADWKEFRAMCVDQNSYDRTNLPKYMNNEMFKVASADSGITLSSSGTAAAEVLVGTLVGAEQN